MATYTLSQDSMIWQSLSESDAIDFASKQLIRIHGICAIIVKVLFARGIFTSFISFQENELVNPLQVSISNMHFIGQYTSLSQGWVESFVLLLWKKNL